MPFRSVESSYAGKDLPRKLDFECEFLSDISTLPTNLPWGSSAFVWENASLWYLGSDGVWKEPVE